MIRDQERRRELTQRREKLDQQLSDLSIGCPEERPIIQEIELINRWLRG